MHHKRLFRDRNSEENKPKHWKLPGPVLPQESQARAELWGARLGLSAALRGALSVSSGQESSRRAARDDGQCTQQTSPVPCSAPRVTEAPGCFTAPVPPAVSLWVFQPGLPVLLPLLLLQRCPGFLSSLLNPPGLAIQLLSQLCKKLRTSSYCQLREQLCFSLFQWKSFGMGLCCPEQPIQVSQLHSMQGPLVLLRC